MENENILCAYLMCGIIVFLILFIIYSIIGLILENSITWFGRRHFRIVEFGTTNPYNPPGNRLKYRIEGKNILGFWQCAWSWGMTYYHDRDVAEKILKAYLFRLDHDWYETYEFDYPSYFNRRFKVFKREEQYVTSENVGGTIQNETNYKVYLKNWRGKWKCRFESHSKEKIDIFIRQSIADKKVKRIVKEI